MEERQGGRGGESSAPAARREKMRQERLSSLSAPTCRAPGTAGEQLPPPLLPHGGGLGYSRRKGGDRKEGPPPGKEMAGRSAELTTA